MTEIDKAIDELREKAKDVKAEIARREHTLTCIVSELRGLERARELFAPAEKAGRLDVQGPVMRLFAKEGGGVRFGKEGVVEYSGLPAAAVHKFLLRAVRNGKLVCKDGVYSLPAQKAAAE
jgi:hypothetical protein